MATGDNYPVLMGFDKAAPGGVATLDASGNVPFEQLGNVSGENLLINAYFANMDSIIDQRKGYVLVKDKPYYNDIPPFSDETLVDIVTVYTTVYSVTIGTDYTSFKLSTASDAETYYAAPADVVRGYVGAKYTIDRWQNTSSGGVVLIEDDGLRFAPIIYFSQTLELPFGALKGKTVSFSVLTEEGLVWGWGEVPYSAPDEYTTFIELKYNSGASARFAYSINSKAFLVDVMRAKEVSCPKVIAAKLELGSTQTLAHQDADGNWVLNDPPPNRALELAKCQRYFYGSLTARLFCTHRGSSNDIWTVVCSFPETMRTSPAVPKAKLRVNVLGTTDYDTTIAPDSIKSIGTNTNGISHIRIDTNILNAEKIYNCSFENISAEL